MEKAKRVEAGFEIPEAILQHIQSFLNAKEAAQTTLLSKSWYASWLTRPNLNFVQKDFAWKSGNYTVNSASTLWKFVKRTVERYEKLNLRIRSLRLWIYGPYDVTHFRYSLVNGLIIKALKMGATGLDFKNHNKNFGFDLPYEVFESETLITLSASGCGIGLRADGKVSCSKLKSLTLEEVCVGGDVIWDIISTCRLIENMSLSIYDHPLTEFGKRIVLHEFRNLKHLLLSRVNVHPWYFVDLSSRFPCLKDLAVHHCGVDKVISISSLSLERVELTQEKKLRVKFDIPNIRKFASSGSTIPSLSFKTTTSYKWESDISITRQYPPSARWFLSLEILSNETLDDPRDIPCLPKPDVENLAIHGPCSVYPALFYILFPCCRPTYVTQHWYPKSDRVGKESNDFSEFVYKRMVNQVGFNSCIAYQRMFGDLEEVSVEFYDEFVSAWRPGLLDTLGVDEHKIRLHLRWGC